MIPRSPSNVCTYCGANLSDVSRDREHCVGRQFFPEPRPKDLDKVIVPSCRPCNEAPKKDEDYLRGLLSMSGTALSPTGQLIYPTAMRGLEKDRGLRRTLARGFEVVHLRSPEGIHLGRHRTQKVEWARIRRVLKKWVCGLHWKEFGARLPSATPLDVAMMPLHLVRGFQPTRRSLGSWPGVFEYWVASPDNDPLHATWVFLVWGSRGFIAATNQVLDVELPGATM